MPNLISSAAAAGETRAPTSGCGDRRSLLFASLCVQEFVHYMCLYSPNAFFPQFAYSKMGLTVAEVGYVYAANPCSSFIATLFIGALHTHGIFSPPMFPMTGALKTELRRHAPLQSTNTVSFRFLVCNQCRKVDVVIQPTASSRYIGLDRFRTRNICIRVVCSLVARKSVSARKHAGQLSARHIFWCNRIFKVHFSRK